MTEDKPQSFNFQQDLDVLASAVSKAAEARLGTFSQRNPLLGKMVRCRFCRQRRRQNEQLPCCSAKYAKEYWTKTLTDGTREKREYSEPTTEPKIRGRKNPRLTRHRPPLFLMRQRLLDLEEEPLLIGPLQDSVEGLKGFWTPQKEVQPQHLAVFVERVILRELKMSAKRKRAQQKLSRKINRK